MAQPQEFSNREEFDNFFRDVLKWPLYRELRYRAGTNIQSLPELVMHFCNTCQYETNWFRDGSLLPALLGTRGVGVESEDPNHHTKTGTPRSHTYTCKNCTGPGSRITIFFVWGEDQKDGTEPLAGLLGRVQAALRYSVFVKVGQYPALDERIEPALRKELDVEELALYSRAIRCRNFGMGIASVAYMRRVVERKTFQLLDLIVELDRSHGESGVIIEEIAKIKTTRTSEILDFAGKILPKSLKPGGRNPLDGLYGVFSDGLHNLPEDECVKIFDEAQISFEYLFKKLRAELDDAATYLKATEALHAKKKDASRSN